MNEFSPARLWLMRAGYVALGLAIIFFQLLPLETLPRRFAGPDLLLAFTCAWAVRRPEFTPALSIAALMLVADMLFQRPPGLFSALVLLGAGALKRRSVGLRDQTFAVEWLVVSVMLVVVLLSYRFVLLVLLIPQAPLGLSLIQAVMTIATYPLIALVTAVLFGVQKAQPGDVDGMGSRI